MNMYNWYSNGVESYEGDCEIKKIMLFTIIFDNYENHIYFSSLFAFFMQTTFN